MDPRHSLDDLVELGTLHGVRFLSSPADEPWDSPTDALIFDVPSEKDLTNLLDEASAQYPTKMLTIDKSNISKTGVDVAYLHDGTAKETPYAIWFMIHTEDPRQQEDRLFKVLDQCFSDSNILSITLRWNHPTLGTFDSVASRLDAVFLRLGEANKRTAQVGSLNTIVVHGIVNEQQIREIQLEFESIARFLRTQRPRPRRLAGGLARDLVNPNEYIDASQDRLGVSPYASMLATVITARDTPLPLSIGLFGEWGSGKSFFMGMLRAQVAKLEGSPGNCKKVAQIGFNAWHYADANLWASLGDEIFRQLAEPRPRPGETRDEYAAREREGAALRQELAAELEQRQQLIAVTQQAEAEAAELRGKIRAVDSVRMSTGRRLLVAVRHSDAISAEAKKVWTALGVKDDVEQGRLLADQLQGALHDTAELGRVSHYRYGRTALLLAGFTVIAGLCGSLLVPFVKEWLAGVTALVGGLLAAGTTWIGRARTGLRRLSSLAMQLQHGIADAPVADEVAALEKVEADRRVAEAQLQQVVDRVGVLGRQLAELTPGRRLYAFLAERSQAEDYGGNLGLISTIRKDFEKLVALLTERSDEGDAASPVDRIVLYIDDLDRCSPQQVVEVLQAVHLLLAFDLFVVVVGVDPRWLLRSISSHYDKLIEAEPTASRDGWYISPEDYLEKILNIPLVLPRMPTNSLRHLLQGMIESGDGSAQLDDTTSTSEADATPSAALADPLGVVQVEQGSQVATQLDPELLPEAPHPLTKPEIDLLAQLDQLIKTPRDAKRLLNLYRMVRSTRYLSESSAFLEREYQAVVVLLGAFAAHSALSSRFAGAILQAEPESKWTDFLAKLKPKQVGDTWQIAAIGGKVHGEEVESWNHLHVSLVQLSAEVSLDELRVFQTWVPRVRPFSYIISTTGR